MEHPDRPVPATPSQGGIAPRNSQLTSPSGVRPETAEEWEQVRRSVAMLPPGAWAMRREQSLDALAALLATLRKTPKR